MDNLTYKGFKGTRLVSLAIINIMAVLFLWNLKITSGDWVELVKWSFLIYAGSEVGAKAASSYSAKEANNYRDNDDY